jgi:hypothetical protein
MAGVTDAITGAMIASYQGYPGRLLAFQVAMLGLGLLLATPFRWVWVLAFLLLIGGVILAAASVGFFYIPTVCVAGWVMTRRLNRWESRS